MMRSRSISFVGVCYAIVTFFIWASYPLIWSPLFAHGILPPQLLAHRIVWACASGIIIFFIRKKYQHVVMRQPAGRHVYVLSVVSGLINGSNWLLALYAVSKGRIVELSLAYFLAPLFDALFGVVYFKERLLRLQKFALLLVAIAIGFVSFRMHATPVLMLLLAFTSASYTAVRRKLPIDTIQSLCIETGVWLPVALAYLGYLFTQQQHVVALGPDMGLLLLAGFATACSIVTFARAAKRLSIITLGLLQYIYPTAQFITGIWLFREDVTPDKIILFGCLVVALPMYVFSRLQSNKPQ